MEKWAEADPENARGSISQTVSERSHETLLLSAAGGNRALEQGKYFVKNDPLSGSGNPVPTSSLH